MSQEFWTPVRIASLLEQKKRGKSGTEIAKFFGVTKNSVAGAVFRCNHPEMFRIKKQRAEMRARLRAEKAEQRKAFRKAFGPKSPREERRRARNRAWTFGTQVGTIRREREEQGGKEFWKTRNEGTGKKLCELGARECHWPLGKFEPMAEFFCGARSETGRVYCSKHCDIAYLLVPASYLYKHDPDYDPSVKNSYRP
jgi:GcrA cell cycle regulator